MCLNVRGPPKRLCVERSIDEDEEYDDIYDICEEEIKIVKSKVKNFTIKVDDDDCDEVSVSWTESQSENGCDHDYSKPWCDWC